MSSPLRVYAFRSPSRNVPTSTARRIRSSQSIRSPAKVRLTGNPRTRRSARLDQRPEHEDVEQLGAGSRAGSLRAFAKPALKLVGSHDRSYAVVPASRGHARSTGPSQLEAAPSLTAENVGGAAAKSPGRRQRARGLYRLGTRRRPV